MIKKIGQSDKEIAWFFFDQELNLDTHARTTAGTTQAPKIKPLPTLKSMDIIIYLSYTYPNNIEPHIQFLLKGINQNQHIITANYSLITQYANDILQALKKAKSQLLVPHHFGELLSMTNTFENLKKTDEPRRIVLITDSAVQRLFHEMDDDDQNYENQLSKISHSNPSNFSNNSLIHYKDQLNIFSALFFGALKEETQTTPFLRLDQLENDDFTCAKRFKYKIRLVAIAEKTNNSVMLKISPMMIKENHSLTNNNFSQALLIQTDDNEYLYTNFFASEKKAMEHYLSSIISNGMQLAKQLPSKDFNDHMLLEILHNATTITTDPEWKSYYYLRVHAEDHPGVLAQIAQILCSNGIEIDELEQKAHCKDNDGCVDITIFTQPVFETTLIKTIQSLCSQKAIVNKIRCMPVFHPDVFLN